VVLNLLFHLSTAAALETYQSVVVLHLRQTATQPNASGLISPAPPQKGHGSNQGVSNLVVLTLLLSIFISVTGYLPIVIYLVAYISCDFIQPALNTMKHLEYFGRLLSKQKHCRKFVVQLL
jgi:hypothetical protein